MTRASMLVVTALLIVAFAGQLANSHSAVQASQDASSKISPTALERLPITLSMSVGGRFSKGKAWFLSVNSAGQAELTMGYGDSPLRRQFTVSQQQMADLRKALKDNQFFDLGDQYGPRAADSVLTTITVTVGRWSKAITLHNTPPKPSEAECRVVRVALLIHNWFDDKEAVDMREWYQRALGKCQ
jgi:hypothetical protein